MSRYRFTLVLEAEGDTPEAALRAAFPDLQAALTMPLRAEPPASRAAPYVVARLVEDEPLDPGFSRVAFRAYLAGVGETVEEAWEDAHGEIDARHFFADYVEVTQVDSLEDPEADDD